MTVREAATYLRCSVGEIHRRIMVGQLTRYYCGTRILVARGEIVASVIASSVPLAKRGRPLKRFDPPV
jgi:excisionase family DNA binding protein